jgi:hypothetical protein
MGYLTEAILDTTLDLPVTVPSTLLQMGDWLVVASIQIVEPMQLIYKWMDLQLITSSVPIADIDATNLIYGNLGLIYLVLRQDYVGGSPGQGNALDTVIITSQGVFARDPTNIITLNTPATYSWIVANNCQPSSTSLVPASSSIDFTLTVTGQARLQLTPA